MAAPYIEFAYLSHNRAEIIVVCHVDENQGPLKLGVSATNGWTVLFNGVTQSLFTGFVADPRPNCCRIVLDSSPLASDAVTIYYTSAGAQIQDQAGQLLTTILSADAITVRKCLPVIDLIAHNVASTLRNVAPGAGATEGYLNTLTVYSDLKSPKDRPLAEGLTQITYEEPTPEDEAPLGHEQYTANFHVVTTFAISTAGSTNYGPSFTSGQEPLTDKGFQYEADIWKALNVDYTRGNLAVDTIAGKPDFFPVEGVGGWGAVSVNFTVRFRNLLGNRFEQ